MNLMKHKEGSLGWMMIRLSTEAEGRFMSGTQSNGNVKYEGGSKCQMHLWAGQNILHHGGSCMWCRCRMLSFKDKFEKNMYMKTEQEKEKDRMI